jgi:hypothetical protein
MGGAMDMVFQQALIEALRYGYVALRLWTARARQTTQADHARRHSAPGRTESNGFLLRSNAIELTRYG